MEKEKNDLKNTPEYIAFETKINILKEKDKFYIKYLEIIKKELKIFRIIQKISFVLPILAFVFVEPKTMKDLIPILYKASIYGFLYRYLLVEIRRLQKEHDKFEKNTMDIISQIENMKI